MASDSFSSPEPLGLRFMTQEEATQFSDWEKEERPYPWTPVHFRETQKGRHMRTLVWENGQGPLGFAVLQVVREESYLLNFMIHKSWRRKGRGESFLRKIFEWCRKCGAEVLILDVETQNRSAVRLYERVGFDVVQKRNRAYPRGEPALVMCKKLGQGKTCGHCGRLC